MALSQGKDHYIQQLQALERRLESDAALRRRTGRLFYFSSALSAGVYGLLCLGYRLKLSLPKVALYLYTVNPVCEWVGSRVLEYKIEDLVRD